MHFHFKILKNQPVSFHKKISLDFLKELHSTYWLLLEELRTLDSCKETAQVLKFYFSHGNWSTNNILVLRRVIHLAVLVPSLRALDNGSWLYLTFKKYFWLYKAAISLKKYILTFWEVPVFKLTTRTNEVISRVN